MLSFFYRLLNYCYRFFLEKHYALHAPLFTGQDDSIFRAQLNFVDYCLRTLPSFEGKSFLDVGCGNGAIALHIFRNFHPAYVTGVDLVTAQIMLARESIRADERTFVEFRTDDAQSLASIPDASIDFLFCVESALHYPQKELFIAQVSRVLRTDGTFVIADLITEHGLRTSARSRFYLHNWSYEKYLHAFSGAELELKVDEDISDVVRASTRQLLPRSWRDLRRHRPLAVFFVFPFVVPFLLAYRYQLEKRSRYHLFIGKKV